MTEREMTVELVTSTTRFAQHVAAAADEPLYGVDTEFSSAKTYYPRLALVQISWPDRIILVDPFTVDLQPLVELFAGPGTAIAHSATNDLDVLDQVIGARPSAIFDTQIAAELVGMEKLSLQAITAELLSIELDKAEQLRDWTMRPLPDAALDYAALDVAHLFDLRDELLVDLGAYGRLDAMEQECAALLSAPLRTVVLDECWWHLREWNTLHPPAYPYAQQIAKIREELAIMANVPKRHVLRDEVVLSLAQNPPRTAEKAKSMLRRTKFDLTHLPDLLDAIAIADEIDPGSVRLPFEKSSAVDLRPLLSALQTLTREAAEQHHIVPAMVASRADFLARLGGRASRLDRPWRAPIITDQVDATIAAWRLENEPPPLED